MQPPFSLIFKLSNKNSTKNTSIYLPLAAAHQRPLYQKCVPQKLFRTATILLTSVLVSAALVQPAFAEEDLLEQQIKLAEQAIAENQLALEKLQQAPESPAPQTTPQVNPHINLQEKSQETPETHQQTQQQANQNANQQTTQTDTPTAKNITENTEAVIPSFTTEAPQPAEEKPKPPPPPPKTPNEILAKIVPPYDFKTQNGGEFMEKTNKAKWYKGMKINPYTTVRLQVLLDWNHASPGPIDKKWGMNSRKAIRAFQKMHGLKTTGKMNNKIWQLLNQGKNAKLPALVKYTITKEDVRTRFRRTPKGYAAKARDWELSYNNIYEMFGERFHMNVNFLKYLNKGIKFRAGNTITVVNVGRHNNEKIDNVLVDKRRNILYAYSGKRIVATYPTTIGARTPKSGRTYSIVGKVYMPTYKAETKEKRYILPPGPNNPVGIAWMALSKPTFGIHGSPQPEGISRQRSMGCVRLTNWDAAELYATIKNGARVRFK